MYHLQQLNCCVPAGYAMAGRYKCKLDAVCWTCWQSADLQLKCFDRFYACKFKCTQPAKLFYCYECYERHFVLFKKRFLKQSKQARKNKLTHGLRMCPVCHEDCYCQLEAHDLNEELAPPPLPQATSTSSKDPQDPQDPHQATSAEPNVGAEPKVGEIKCRAPSDA